MFSFLGTLSPEDETLVRDLLAAHGFDSLTET